MRGFIGGAGGPNRLPKKKHKNIGLLNNTGLDSLKITKLPSQRSMLGHRQHVECWLGSFAIFQGIGTSMAKKPFLSFSGGSGPPVPLSGSAHEENHAQKMLYNKIKNK